MMLRAKPASRSGAARKPVAGAWVVLPLSVVFLAAGLLLTAGVLGGCERPSGAPQVLLIGIDGADWRMIRPLMDAGELPHLQRLMETGVYGPLWSLQPIISPVIWTTIATGKGPDQHGVLDFTVPDPNSGRMIVVTSQVRQSKAFWNILSEQNLRTCVVGWWASWPAEPVDGVLVSDRLSYHAFIESPEAEAGLVYPEERLAEIRELRDDAEEVSYETARQFLAVSEAEYRAAPALDFYDPISHFRHIYQTMAGYTRITEHLMRRERPDLLAVYFEGVDTAGHMYMRYAPPPYPNTSEEERRKFGQTVAAFYRYQDRILGELLALTDESTNVIVVSDHGFLMGRERPIEEKNRFDYANAARWHRIEGVVIMKGPAFKSATTSPGEQSPFRRASVFDITPTLLAVLGLPAGEDMDGRVLTEMLRDDFPVPERITTHEDEAWRENRATARASIPGVDEEMKERLRSLGYIGADDTDAELSLWGQWSLAQYYLFRKEMEKAEHELDALRARDPDWPDSYFLLGMLYTEERDFPRAAQMYEKVLALDPARTEAQTNLAFIYRQLDRRAEAVDLLVAAADGHPYRADLRVNLGILLRETGQLNEAHVRLNEALRLDPTSHPANAQMALLCEALERPAQAARHWAVALKANPQDTIARQHLDALQEQGYRP